MDFFLETDQQQQSAKSEILACPPRNISYHRRASPPGILYRPVISQQKLCHPGKIHLVISIGVGVLDIIVTERLRMRMRGGIDMTAGEGIFSGGFFFGKLTSSSSHNRKYSPIAQPLLPPSCLPLIPSCY